MPKGYSLKKQSKGIKFTQTREGLFVVGDAVGADVKLKENKNKFSNKALNRIR